MPAQSGLQNANMAIVSAITSMSELLVASLLSLNTCNYVNLNNSLKIHEENTKKITALSVVLYVIKFHANLHKL